MESFCTLEFSRLLDVESDICSFQDLGAAMRILWYLVLLYLILMRDEKEEKNVPDNNPMDNVLAPVGN